MKYQTRMHSSRMHTARLLTVLHPVVLGGSAPPPTCRPLLDADPPGHVTCDACWEAIPPMNRMTDRHV